MNYPVWPAGLTRFERSGWSSQRQEARRFRPNETGPAGVRRRFSAVAELVSLSLIVSRAQLEDFRAFYRDDCAEGSNPFWMPDPITDGWSLLDQEGRRILDLDGRPLLAARNWLCRFGDQPPAESIYMQSHFRVAFGVMVFP